MTAVWDAIAARIKDFGYYVGSDQAYDKAIKSGRILPSKSGLDISKRTANSFFYLPCRAGLGLKFTFWREHWDADIPLLNPELWITYAPLAAQEYSITEPYKNPASPLLERVRQRLANDGGNRQGDDTGHAEREAGRIAAKDAAIAQWRATPAGQGNPAFYQLGCRLKAAGYDDFEVRATLEQEAAYARSPSDRKAQIKSIMSSLKKVRSKIAA